MAHIAAAMGVSHKCVKIWIDRYAAEGEAGLVTRSSRPHSTPTRTSDEVEQRVLAHRVEHAWAQTCTGKTCAAFLQWAAAYFTNKGVTRIRRVMTDNATARSEANHRPAACYQP